MKHRFTLLILMVSSWIIAQERGMVTGLVRDAATGQPMVAVNISADRKSGTISDQDGRFSLSLTRGNHLIEFYYVGFERASREVSVGAGSTVHVDVEMEIIRRMLDEVVVSAGKYEQKLSDVTVSLDVIKPHQLSNQNITSLDMILEKTPGISILDGQPSIRGGSGFSYGVGSRVMMLVDDLPMIAGDAGDIKWNYMPVENLNQIEVIKGASSVLYGSSALNGAINLRTRFPGNEPSTEATVYGGIYGDPRRSELVWWSRRPFFAGSSLSHLRKLGNLELSVGGNYHKDEGYREGDYENRIRGNLALRYRFNKIRGLTAGLSSSAMYIDQADFLLWLNADSGAYLQNPETITPLTGHRYNIDPYLEYFTPNGNRHSLKTRLYSVGNLTLNVNRNSFTKLWYGEYRYLKKFGNQNHWTSGLSFSRTTVLANLYENHNGSNTSAYSQLDLHLLNRLKISSGIRWELNTLNGELFYSLPVFRAGLNYQAGTATFIRTSFGQGYRFPSVAEKFAEAVVGGLRIFSNPSLEPERGWAAELGIKQGFAVKEWSGYVDLAFFSTGYRNMIEYTFGAYPEDTSAIPTFDDVGFKALNIGTARISGIEVSLNGAGQVGPVTLLVTGGYTFMDPVDPSVIKESGRAAGETHILKYRRRHLLKWDLEVEVWKLMAGINLQYNSRMINVDEVFIDPLVGNMLQPGFPAYWEEEAGGYALVDARLGWNIRSWIRTSAIIVNLLNKEYLGRPGDIGPPRNFTLQVKFNF